MRELFATGHRVPNAPAALVASKYASAASGERAVWMLGYDDGTAGNDERRAINHRWRPIYIAGVEAGINATRVPDPITDVEIE